MTARPGQSHASQGPAGVEPRRGGGRAGRGVYGKRSLAGTRQRRRGRSSPGRGRVGAAPRSRSRVRSILRSRAGAGTSLHRPKPTRPGSPKVVDSRATATNAVAPACSWTRQLAIPRRTRGTAGQWVVLKRVFSLSIASCYPRQGFPWRPVTLKPKVPRLPAELLSSSLPH